MEIDGNEEIHERIEEEPQPSKRKRTDPKGVRHNVVANIRVIQEREDRENPVLARQRMNIEALKKVIEEGEIEEDYD